jgi:hypothetical protein
LGFIDIWFWCLDIKNHRHSRTKNSNLFGGLVCANSAQLGGAICSEQNQRNPRVVSFEHCGVQVGNCGARCGDQGNGRLGRQCSAQGCEGHRSLINSHVQLDSPSACQLFGRNG